jgi:HSP20 family molecular chaperone IbpA
LGTSETRATHGAQLLPVRIYESDGRVMVAAPMPGLAPHDISVSVAGDRVTIHGVVRGPGQDERGLSVAEWAIGPHHRNLTLSQPLDGARANATYGNGVLVLALPKSDARHRGGASRDTTRRDASSGQPTAQDPVRDQSNDSFPASDPPSWTGVSS